MVLLIYLVFFLDEESGRKNRRRTQTCREVKSDRIDAIFMSAGFELIRLYHSLGIPSRDYFFFSKYA